MNFEELIKTNEEDLYMTLVSDDEYGLYSKDGIVERGKELFFIFLEETKDSICKKYKKQKQEVNTVLDASILIAGVLSSKTILTTSFIYLFAVLCAKYGIEKICRGDDSSSK